VPYTLVDQNKRERELLDEVKRIVDILRTQDVEQVILFGSLAAKYPSSCGDAASPVESEAPRGRRALSRGADPPCGDIDLIGHQRYDQEVPRPARRHLLGRAATEGS